MKKCSVCKTDKPTTQYHKNKAKKDGLGSTCKNCRKFVHRNHYTKNKVKYLEKAKTRKAEITKWYRDYKDGKMCPDCKKTWPWYVLQFDHVSGEKEHVVSQLVGYGNQKALLNEIAKCELICANCHATRTHNRLQNAAIV